MADNYTHTNQANVISVRVQSNNELENTEMKMRSIN